MKEHLGMAACPKQIDTWNGRIEQLSHDENTVFMEIFYPQTSATDTYAHRADRYVPLSQIPEHQRELARRALAFTCTVELDEDLCTIAAVHSFDFEEPISIDVEPAEATTI